MTAGDFLNCRTVGAHRAPLQLGISIFLQTDPLPSLPNPSIRGVGAPMDGLSALPWTARWCQGTLPCRFVCLYRVHLAGVGNRRNRRWHFGRLHRSQTAYCLNIRRPGLCCKAGCRIRVSVPSVGLIWVVAEDRSSRLLTKICLE